MKIINEEQKERLLNKFELLKTLDEKLNFWNEHLPFNYIRYFELGSSDESHKKYGCFEFSIDKKDWDKFGKWVVSNYHKLSDEPKKYKTLLVFELMVREFENEFNETSDKLQHVKKELFRIKTSFKQTASRHRSSLFGNEVSITNTLYDVDFTSFEAYKDLELKPDYSDVYPFVYSVLNKENGYTLGRYWKYLEELEKRLSQQPKVKEFTLDQKLLILHYLGSLKQIMEIKTATKQAKFLQKLISDDAEKTRQRFSTINDLVGTPKEGAKRRKLIEEITDLQKMFKELGLQNIVKKIQADLRKLSQ
jgi:hypothetical protein